MCDRRITRGGREKEQGSGASHGAKNTGRPRLFIHCRLGGMPGRNAGALNLKSCVTPRRSDVRPKVPLEMHSEHRYSYERLPVSSVTNTTPDDVPRFADSPSVVARIGVQPSESPVLTHETPCDTSQAALGLVRRPNWKYGVRVVKLLPY